MSALFTENPVQEHGARLIMTTERNVRPPGRPKPTSSPTVFGGLTGPTGVESLGRSGEHRTQFRSRSVSLLD